MLLPAVRGQSQSHNYCLTWLQLSPCWVVCVCGRELGKFLFMLFAIQVFWSPSPGQICEIHYFLFNQPPFSFMSNEPLSHLNLISMYTRRILQDTVDALPEAGRTASLSLQFSSNLSIWFSYLYVWRLFFLSRDCSFSVITSSVPFLASPRKAENVMPLKESSWYSSLLFLWILSN